MFFAEGIDIDNDILPKILIESPLTVLSSVTVGVKKFILTKLGIVIDVIESVSAMKSIGLSPNLAAMRMQRLPPEVAAHKLGVTSLRDLLGSFRGMLVLCVWVSVLATDTMVYLISPFQQSRDNSAKFVVFDLL